MGDPSPRSVGHRLQKPEEERDAAIAAKFCDAEGAEVACTGVGGTGDGPDLGTSEYGGGGYGRQSPPASRDEEVLVAGGGGGHRRRCGDPGAEGRGNDHARHGSEATI